MSIKDKLESEVLTVFKKEAELKELETELAQDAKFQAFLTKQKNYTTQIAEFWKEFEQKMIDNDIRQIKGDWGTLTIAKRTNWDVDETQLPNKFFKKVINTKRIGDTYKLEGKAPKGCTPRIKQYLQKRINNEQ